MKACYNLLQNWQKPFTVEMYRKINYLSLRPKSQSAFNKQSCRPAQFITDKHTAYTYCCYNVNVSTRYW